MKPTITYTRTPRQSKKPPRDTEQVAREIIRRMLFGATPSIVLDARDFFATQPSQDSMNGVIEHLTKLHPQTNCKAYAYTNLSGFRLVQYDTAIGAYVWNSDLWAQVKNQILILKNLI